MPLPGALTLTTLSGTYTAPDGTPLGGQLTFTPSSALTNESGHPVLAATPLTVRLAPGTGSFSISLLNTDNAGLLPDTWMWHVIVAVAGAQETYFFGLPSTLGPTTDINALTPVSPPPAGVTFVASINGQTGDVVLADGFGILPPAGDLGGTTLAPHVTATHLAAPLPIVQGGTGAASGSAALTALGGISAASPAFTGTPTAPTATALADSTQIATTAYADSAVAAEASRAGTAEGLKLAKASNLSDLASAPTARANLGLGTAATLASSAVALTANNLSDLANAATARGNLGAQGVRTPTAVKTGTSYTAVAGDFAKIDSTAGAYTVTLPTAPADKTVLGVKLVASATPVNQVTVTCGGTDKFNLPGGGTTLALKLLNQGCQLQYNSAAGVWDVHGDDLPLGGLDARYGQKAASTDLTVYVSKAGSDSNDGLSAGSAKLTVGAGLTLLSSGGVLRVGPGNFFESLLPLASNTTIKGSGQTLTLIETGASGHPSGDLFAITSGNIIGCVFEDVSLASTVAGGGHLFNFTSGSTGAGNWVFNRCSLAQSNTGASFVNMPDGTWINCSVLNCIGTHAPSATVPAWFLRSSSGAVEGNTWNQYFHSFSGAYAIWIESTSASAYSQGNTIKNVIWEQCVGGFVKLLGCRFNKLENLAAYDNSGSYATILNDGYVLGRGSTGNLACFGVEIENVTRLAGTLSSRSDTGCGTTLNSTTVTDASAVTADAGRQITNANIPAGTTIVSVTAGTGYVLSAAATGTASSQTFVVQLAVDVRCVTSGTARTLLTSCAGVIDCGGTDALLFNTQYTVPAMGTTVLNSTAAVDISPVNGVKSGGVVTAQALAATGISGSLAGARLAGGTVSGHPTTGTYLAGDVVPDQAGVMWICTAGGTPGTWAGGVVSLDSTAADIQPDGTQAAGSTTKAADAGHVHPANGIWLPADNGLLIANGELAAMTTNNTLIGGATGTVYLVKLSIHQALTITRLWFGVNAIGSGTSAGTFAGLYSSAGTLLTGSSDVAATFTSSATLNSATLTTPQAVTAGSFVWAAVLVNLGTTQPKLQVSAATTLMLNGNLSANAFRFAVPSGGTGQTVLPSSFTPSSNTNTGAFAIWAGAS